jgi:DNA-binding NarL/FixJ family response regulator
VALVAGDGSHERIGAILEEQGLEFDLLSTVEQLLEAEAEPSLIVLQVEGALSQAVAGELEPLQREVEGTPVVLVCADIRPGELRVALAAGAAGVVLEDRLASTLGPALAAARAGQVCVPIQHSRQIEPAALSAREKQILGLVVMGYMNGQIAEQLFVAESTVKSHLSSAFAKLGVRSRNEAVDLILDPERGLGMGILSLGGEPVEAASAT